MGFSGTSRARRGIGPGIRIRLCQRIARPRGMLAASNRQQKEAAAAEIEKRAAAAAAS